MSDHPTDRSAAGGGSVTGFGAKRVAVAALAGIVVAVGVARGIGPSTYVVVVVALLGASVGSVVPYLLATRSDDVGAPVDRPRPWFHRGAAGIALGLAALVLLVWGLAFESVRAGYAAAAEVAVIAYALLASYVPRR